jgi:hypothetical protein
MYIFVYAHVSFVSHNESSAHAHDSFKIHLFGSVAHNEHVLHLNITDDRGRCDKELRGVFLIIIRFSELISMRFCLHSNKQIYYVYIMLYHCYTVTFYYVYLCPVF